MQEEAVKKPGPSFGSDRTVHSYTKQITNWTGPPPLSTCRRARLVPSKLRDKSFQVTALVSRTMVLLIWLPYWARFFICLKALKHFWHDDFVFCLNQIFRLTFLFAETCRKFTFTFLRHCAWATRPVTFKWWRTVDNIVWDLADLWSEP